MGAEASYERTVDTASSVEGRETRLKLEKQL